MNWNDITLGVSEPVSECKHEEKCFETEACERTACKAFDVSVPVTVKPFAAPEKPNVKCMGEVTVTPGHKPCESEDNVFKFTVTQRLDVEIPVKFGAKVCLGETCTVDKGNCCEA